MHSIIEGKILEIHQQAIGWDVWHPHKRDVFNDKMVFHQQDDDPLIYV